MLFMRLYTECTCIMRHQRDHEFGRINHRLNKTIFENLGYSTGYYIDIWLADDAVNYFYRILNIIYLYSLFIRYTCLMDNSKFKKSVVIT